MQRLFSMFPAGLAGVALLCVRVGASAMLVVLVLVRNANALDWTLAISVVLALCLCLGALTPYACALSCVIELACFSVPSWSQIAHQFFVVLMTASLAALGPGAFSVDARLFGRRVIKR